MKDTPICYSNHLGILGNGPAVKDWLPC